MIYAYIVGGMVIVVVLHLTCAMRCENAIHAIMGMYAAVLVLGVIERKWPWVLYYFAALLISVAVLWMPKSR